MDGGSSSCAFFVIPPLLSFVVKLVKKRVKGNTIGVVIPRFSGKSHLINTVASNDYLLLDLEENIKLCMSPEERDKLQHLQGNPSYDLHYKPIAKKYYEEIKKQHKDKPIIVFSSSMDLLNYCGLKSGSIYSYIPSSSLCENIKTKLSSANIQIFESSRLELLTKLKPKQLNTYNSYEQLNNLLCQKFKLIAKL